MTTDRAAALVANGKYEKANLADDLGHEIPASAKKEPEMFISVPVADIVRWRKKATKLQKKLAALESSRPAQDIVAEMREVLDSVAGDSVKLNRIAAILSPTKNTAPTEAERD